MRLRNEVPSLNEETCLPIFVMVEDLPQDHPQYERGNKKKRTKGKTAILVSWVGVVVDQDYPPWGTDHRVPHLDMSGFHGTPLVMALRIMKSGSLLQQAPKGLEGEEGRKNRTRSSDNVAYNQVYLGNFETSRRYTLPQMFQNAMNVSCMAVVRARRTKKLVGLPMMTRRRHWTSSSPCRRGFGSSFSGA